MLRSGISTALGTIFFIIIASMFLALMFRMYTTFTSTLSEIASQSSEQLAEGQPNISLKYAGLVDTTTSIRVIVGDTTQSGPGLTVSCLNLSARSIPGGVVFPFPRNACVALVNVSAAPGVFGSMGNFSLSSQGPCFVELFERVGGSWRMTERFFLNSSSVEVSFKNTTLVFAYDYNSTRSFSLTFSNVRGYSLQLLQQAQVVVSNTGYLPLEVYAVYVNGPTGPIPVVQQHVVIPPGGVQVFQLSSGLVPGYEYEVRVVSKLRTYIARIRVGG